MQCEMVRQLKQQTKLKPKLPARLGTSEKLLSILLDTNTGLFCTLQIYLASNTNSL